MATMIPDDIHDFHTDGEERVYRWLAGVPAPDGTLLVWYTPDIQDREPDFLLYSDDVGLVVLEVKDWGIDQILEANPFTVRLRLGSRVETRANPWRQAKDYCSRLKDKIRADKRLLSADPAHHGRPKIPMSAGVVFPNINREEFLALGLADVLPVGRIFFWDDLHPSSPLSSDPSGDAFRGALRERFPPVFAFTLTGQEKRFLGGVLYPEVRVRLPVRTGGQESYREDMESLRLLDHHQEVLARRWDAGHRIIIGPSGSGKTLVLAHKAAFLRRYGRRIERILFVCYNVTLIGYLCRLLGALEVPLGERGVDVTHFFELCARVVGEPIAYEGEDADYYDLVVEQALEKLPRYGLRYDAILVDEGQDFSDDMVRVIVGLLNPATDNLTIALDDAQDIYRRRQASWKELGVHARGRVHRLLGVYRSTGEIARFADRFITGVTVADRGVGEPAAPTAGTRLATEDQSQLTLLDDTLTHHGPEPELRRHPDLGEALASIASTIRRVQAEHGFPLSEFAVLYPMHALPAAMAGAPRSAMRVARDPVGPGSFTLDLPHATGAALDDHGILWRWASEDYRAKRAYDITADSVTVSTVHSVKGLDFACVFLVGFDLLQPGDRWTREQIWSLTYVAITRARTHLFVPYVSRNEVVERMLASLYHR